MKIVLAGGTGQVGTILARAFHADGHDVAVLSRTPRTAPWRSLAWDGAHHGVWAREREGADVVVNLAGRSVNCRYTAENRRLITDSRVNSTRVVGEAIARAARPPRVWLQMSTATIYAHRYDAPNDETTGIIGGAESNAPDTWRFSIDVARSWERALAEAATPRTRKVALRSAMVMSLDRGGVFDTLLHLVLRPGRPRRRWTAVRLMDSRSRLRACGVLAHRARQDRQRRQPGGTATVRTAISCGRCAEHGAFASACRRRRG